ncbi:MAG: hypothetical protein H7829_13985 [Magnetococcus sp. THC-1_WYH]
MFVDPNFAQKELTQRAAANTRRELSQRSHADIIRIAQDEYGLQSIRGDKRALIQQIVNRIMEQA